MKSNIFFVILFVIIIVMLLGLSIRPLIQSNELKEQLKELQAENEELIRRNEELEYDISRELDEENIREIAKEQLDLVDPRDEYFVAD